MKTDAALIARLAGELDALLRGARVADFALDGGGRPALRTTRPDRLVLFDVFAPTPAVLLAGPEAALHDEPGYTRAIAAALRGMRLGGVAAVPGERILRLDFRTRSRFGVVDGYELVVELVPRFGNVLLLKGSTIVAVAKEFGLAENPRRAILAGGPYLPPPPRPGPKAGEGVEGEAGTVLERFAEAARDRERREGALAAEGRRAALARTIERRLAALTAEHERVTSRRDEALARDELAREGRDLYAVAHADPSVKERAAELFARYRKLESSLPHLERRLEQLEGQRATLEELAWQLETGDAQTLTEVGDALAQLEAPRSAPPVRKRRAPLRYELPSGARIFVGRSPQENADVTFRIARPSDLWFHARALPGAHVILQSAPGRDAGPEELEWAAAAAAFHSKAREAERVNIDYVPRKYVRKQRNAPAGRVWYTNAQTLTVRPRDPATA